MISFILWGINDDGSFEDGYADPLVMIDGDWL